MRKLKLGYVKWLVLYYIQKVANQGFLPRQV